MHHRLTPIEAARFGKSIEAFRMFWMEDPTLRKTRPASA
jgi:mannonate dehydratase